MKRPHILYAGDSPAGGPANYLLGIMQKMRAKVTHLPPNEILRSHHLKPMISAIIFSDYSCNRVSNKIQRQVIEKIQAGTGFMMVGGWGSFAGIYGNWQGSLIDRILPVKCAKADDRINWASGLQVIPKSGHPALKQISFHNAPVLIGLNKTSVRTHGKVLLSCKPIENSHQKLRLLPRSYPLLVIDSDPQKRIAALATDFAPHWCGGLVDWGAQRVKVAVTSKIQIEVGHLYLRFGVNLLRWLCRL